MAERGECALLRMRATQSRVWIPAGAGMTDAIHKNDEEIRNDEGRIESRV